jgi:hypothetical protein
MNFSLRKVLPWFRILATGLLLRTLGFEPGPVHKTLVMQKCVPGTELFTISSVFPCRYFYSTFIMLFSGQLDKTVRNSDQWEVFPEI